MTVNSNFALFYVDDSGSETHGITTFSWIRIDPAHWATATHRWIRFRAALDRRHLIPTDVRLHATELAGGRYTSGTGLDLNPQQGLKLIRDGLKVIAGLPGTTLGSVYRRTTARGRSFEHDKQDLYRAMITHLDHQLKDTASFGMIVMDGDGTNPGYHRGHQTLELGERALIEDPFFRHASTSQWVQVADLIAWTAYRSQRLGGRRDKTASWYEQILSQIDEAGSPIEL